MTSDEQASAPMGSIIALLAPGTFPESFEGLTPHPFHTIRIEPQDSIIAILNAIRLAADVAHCIYIEASLQYCEYEGVDGLGGIDIYKHIRYTSGLGPASLLPVIIGGDENPGALVARDSDNVLILAP